MKRLMLISVMLSLNAMSAGCYNVAGGYESPVAFSPEELASLKDASPDQITAFANAKRGKIRFWSADGLEKVERTMALSIDPKTGLQNFSSTANHTGDAATVKELFTGATNLTDSIGNAGVKLGAKAAAGSVGIPIPDSPVPAAPATGGTTTPGAAASTDQSDPAVAAAWAAALGNPSTRGPFTAPLPAGATLPDPAVGATRASDVLRPYSIHMLIAAMTFGTAADVDSLKAGTMTLGKFQSIVPADWVSDPVFSARNAAFARKFQAAKRKAS